MKNLVILLVVAILITGTVDAELAAQSLLSQGQVDVAIADLQKHLKTVPTDAEAYHLLSRAYYSLQHWDDAISAAQKAAALSPGNSDYHLWLGRAYGQKAANSSWFTAIRLAKKVRQEFERAVTLNAGNLAAESDLAEFYVEAPSFLGGGTDKARNQARRLASLDPPSAHWVNANIAEKEKNWAQAENEYRAAIQASGNKASYWLSLASFYRRSGRLSDMEVAVNRASNAEINRSDVWVDAAEILYRGGRNFPAAIEFLRRYLSSNSRVEDAPTFQVHYLLGSIFEKQGNRQGAAEEYRAALALAREFSLAQEGLARVSR
jgi:tetratricopeptide (TPR) repeat protein